MYIYIYASPPVCASGFHPELERSIAGLAVTEAASMPGSRGRMRKKPALNLWQL